MRIVAVGLAQCLEQERSVDEVDAGVHLADLLLGGRGVLLLHDALREALLVADDAAVPLRVRRTGDDERERGPGLPLDPDQLLQRLRRDERRVAAEQEDAAAIGEARSFQRGLRGSHGVPGAELVLLQGELERRAGKQLGQLILYQVGLVPDNRDHWRAIERECGADREVGERASARLVQHLGPVALHASALAGGEDYGCDGVHPCSFPSTFQPPARAATRQLLVGLASCSVNRRTRRCRRRILEIPRAKRMPC